MSPIQRVIISELKAASGKTTTYETLAAASGAGRTTIWRHLQRLEEASVIQKEGTGGRGSFVYIVDQDRANDLMYS